ncbi:MAG: hypothetical protein FWH12_09885 [Treponema sp.]|nr:hypothetical protein [Treponema sp.]
MNQQTELLNIVNKLPQRYLSEAVSFLGYLQHKAEQETTIKEHLVAREKAAFIKYADELNTEAEDVLSYQAPIFENKDNEE